MPCSKPHSDGQYSEGAETCQPLLRRLVDSGGRWIGQVLWPARCILCGGAGEMGIDLCRDCAADLPRNDPACTVCAEPFAAAGAESRVCGECLRDPPPFRAAFVPFRYAYPLDHLVRGLKFRGDLPCGRALGQMFSRCLLERGDPLPEAIVPVPLASRRYRQRGYNQATELALAIADVTGSGPDDRRRDPAARDRRASGLESQSAAAERERSFRGDRAGARASHRDPRRRRYDR